MNDTLIHACEMFLLPTTILFLAFAMAPSERLKALISALGVITSIIWAFHIIFWTGILTSVDFASSLILSLIFLVAWAIVAYPHARSWRFDVERV
jgi:hypothetical protein